MNAKNVMKVIMLIASIAAIIAVLVVDGVDEFCRILVMVFSTFCATTSTVGIHFRQDVTKINVGGKNNQVIVDKSQVENKVDARSIAPVIKTENINKKD